MAVNSSSFQLITQRIDTDTTRKVDHIDVEVLAKDCQGIVYMTDIMFQSGTVATTWVGHVSEIRWSFDNA
jgi:hypothetical protein